MRGGGERKEGRERLGGGQCRYHTLVRKGGSIPDIGEGWRKRCCVDI